MRTCTVEGCNKPSGQGGRRYCAMHYSRLRRTGDPTIRSTRIKETSLPCVIEGCTELRAGRGLCKTHWQHWKRNGDPEAAHRRPPQWTPREIDALLHLERHHKTGFVKPGQYEGLSISIGRSVVACCSKMFELRRAAKAEAGQA